MAQPSHLKPFLPLKMTYRPDIERTLKFEHLRHFQSTNKNISHYTKYTKTVLTH